MIYPTLADAFTELLDGVSMKVIRHDRSDQVTAKFCLDLSVFHRKVFVS